MGFLPSTYSAEAFEFLGANTHAKIPFQLEYSNQNTLWIAMIGLTASFILLAISQMTASNLIVIFSRVLYKNATVQKIVKEEYSLASLPSLTLLLNFIITSTILLYLTSINFKALDKFETIYFLPIVPLYFFLWPMFCYNLVGFLSGQADVLRENKYNNVLFSEIVGVFFSLLLLLWTFNIKWAPYFIYIFIIISIFFWMYKIFRGILFSINKGVAWYYIILYFCTLEILPFILLYSIFRDEIESFWKIV